MGWQSGLRLNVAWVLGVAGCFDEPVPTDTESTSGSTAAESSGSTAPMGSESGSSTSTGTPPDGSSESSGVGGDSTSLEGSSSGAETTDLTSDGTTGDTSGSTGASVGSTSAGPTTDPSESTSDASSDSISATESSSGPSEDSSGFVGFIVPADLGPNAECSVWDQDCPEGEKCSAWANDGGDVWNAWRCVPIAPSPGAVGDPCTVEGSAVSGVDTCEQGAICFHVDPETNEGICSGFCVGAEENPVCDDPEDACVDVTGEGLLPLCLPTCDPLVQDCAGDDGCYGDGVMFVCAPDASGDGGAEGAACASMNACDPGLACVSAGLVPGCAAESCCASFCDVELLDCPAALECIAYFEAGMEPPGLEHVGVCGDPP
jgi:hypothetical protein